jgi:hypothetical protein
MLNVCFHQNFSNHDTKIILDILQDAEIETQKLKFISNYVIILTSINNYKNRRFADYVKFSFYS